MFLIFGVLKAVDLMQVTAILSNLVDCFWAALPLKLKLFSFFFFYLLCIDIYDAFYMVIAAMGRTETCQVVDKL